MDRRLELIGRARWAGCAWLVVAVIPAILALTACLIGLRTVGMYNLAVGASLWTVGLLAIGGVLISAHQPAIRIAFGVSLLAALALTAMTLLDPARASYTILPALVLALASAKLAKLSSEMSRAFESVPRATAAVRLSPGVSRTASLAASDRPARSRR